MGGGGVGEGIFRVFYSAFFLYVKFLSGSMSFRVMISEEIGERCQLGSFGTTGFHRCSVGPGLK